MISYEYAIRSKLVIGLFISLYCGLSFAGIDYPVRLMLFGMAAYHAYLFWEVTPITNKGAEFKCLKITTK
ncbi:hypothetical protein BPS10C_027 [Bacillus phage BPS10C]|uniref:Uncharacterized protein n=1 Tax=Bacillus phage BPS10C TaxID=1277886 RepID=W5QUM8_9CAUD|nr:hypothetical protein BPS10C_027 [Bacillus phage BPS10C]AGI12024.1 hypothetical protein BPS10C_027 [Bacillus phage BPS10C]